MALGTVNLHLQKLHPMTQYSFNALRINAIFFLNSFNNFRDWEISAVTYSTRPITCECV